MKQQTAMQDLREDLILTEVSVKESLLEIENQEIREACQKVVSLTLKNIIKRIDEELLEMEKQQQGYSEEEVIRLLIIKPNLKNEQEVNQWFEQFKKK